MKDERWRTEPAPRPAIVSGPNLPGRTGLATTGTGVFNTLSGNTGSRITYQQGSFLGFDTGSSNIIYSNAIGDSYPNMGLMKLGLGTLSLYGANSYGGGTAIQNGTLAVSTTLPLPAGTVVTLGDAANDSGELVLGNGFNQWDQTLAGLYASGSGTGNRVAGTGIGTSTLTLDVTSGTDEFGGVLAGLALAVTGGGTVVLSGDEHLRRQHQRQPGWAQRHRLNHLGGYRQQRSYPVGHRQHRHRDRQWYRHARCRRRRQACQHGQPDAHFGGLLRCGPDQRRLQPDQRRGRDQSCPAPP